MLCAMWVARRSSMRLHGTLKQKPMMTGALTMPSASVRRMPNGAPALATVQAKGAKVVALVRLS